MRLAGVQEGNDLTEEPLPYRYEYLCQLAAEWKAEVDRVRDLSLPRRALATLRQSFRPWSPCEGRQCVESLLTERHEAPIRAWSVSSVGWEDAEPFLKQLAESLDWPNHHFLPNDPLASVFLPSVNEFAPYEFLYAAKRLTQPAIADGDLRELIEADATVETMIAAFHQP